MNRRLNLKRCCGSILSLPLPGRRSTQSLRAAKPRESSVVWGSLSRLRTRFLASPEPAESRLRRELPAPLQLGSVTVST